MSKINYILIEAALERILKLSQENKNLQESISMASKEYRLSEDETKTINDIITKASIEPSNIEDDFDVTQTIIQKPEYIIAFDDEKELNESIGRLMYNRIPWDSICHQTHRIFFGSNEDLMKAIKVLKSYEFVSSSNLYVGNIFFDDIDNLKKVIDFMTKNDMFIEPQIKDATMVTGELETTSFDAKMPSNTEMDIDNNAAHRSIFCRKIW